MGEQPFLEFNMKMLWLIVALGITSLCDGRSVEVSRSKGHMAYNRQLFSSITNATVAKILCFCGRSKKEYGASEEKQGEVKRSASNQEDSIIKSGNISCQHWSRGGVA